MTHPRVENESNFGGVRIQVRHGPSFREPFTGTREFGAVCGFILVSDWILGWHHKLGVGFLHCDSEI